MEVSELGQPSWWSIEQKIRRGEHPDPKDIAEVLRAHVPPPPIVADYLAGLIDGTVKRPRGPRPKPPFDKLRDRTFNPLALAEADIRRYKWIMRHRYRRVRGVHAEALEWAAERYGLDATTLHDFMRRSKKSRT